MMGLFDEVRNCGCWFALMFANICSTCVCVCVSVAATARLQTENPYIAAATAANSLWCAARSERAKRYRTTHTHTTRLFACTQHNHKRKVLISFGWFGFEMDARLSTGVRRPQPLVTTETTTTTTTCPPYQPVHPISATRTTTSPTPKTTREGTHTHAHNHTAAAPVNRTYRACARTAVPDHTTDRFTASQPASQPALTRKHTYART